MLAIKRTPPTSGEYLPTETDHAHLIARQFYSINQRDQFFDESGNEITGAVMAALRDKDCDPATTAKILEHVFDLDSSRQPTIEILNRLAQTEQLHSIAVVSDKVKILLRRVGITLTQNEFGAISMVGEAVIAGVTSTEFRRFIYDELRAFPKDIINTVVAYLKPSSKLTQRYYEVDECETLPTHFGKYCAKASAQGKVRVLNLILKKKMEGLADSNSLWLVNRDSMNLKGLHLAGLKLNAPNNKAVLFRMANFEDTDLSDAQLSNISIIKGQMKGINLTRARLHNVFITGTAIGPKAKLHETEIVESTFIDGIITRDSTVTNLQVKQTSFNHFPIEPETMGGESAFEQVTLEESPISAKVKVTIKTADTDPNRRAYYGLPRSPAKRTPP